MIKRVFTALLCVTSIAYSMAENRNNIDTILSDYRKKGSILAKELKKAKVWEFLKNNEEKADKAAIETLYKVYAEEVMYGDIAENDLEKAWQEIKSEKENDREELHSLEPLRRLPPVEKRIAYGKKDESLRTNVLKKEYKKLTR
jgi:hypothetical protein